MNQKSYNSSISESRYFNAREEKRKKFKQTFLKKATKNSQLALPYKNFDIAQSRNKGIIRLEKTKERVIKSNECLTLEIKSKRTYTEEQKLYIKKNQENLKRIELVETAHEIQKKNTPFKKAKFNQLNRELYGTVDRKLFENLLAEKKYFIENFEPKSDLAKDFKNKLQHKKFLMNVKSRPTNPPTDLMKNLNRLIKKRYKCIFELIGENKIYDAKSAQKVFKKIMKELDFDWRVCVSEDISVVTDSMSDHTLKLPKDLNRTGRELIRLAVHEIGVHTARAIYGRKNGGPILEFGTAGYLRAEEGLAVLFECATEKNLENLAFERASYHYLTAGFAMGIDGKKRNAIEVFNLLVPFLALENAKNGEITEEVLEKSQNEAYRHVENAFRGTDWKTRGMVYLKLKIYYEGLIENIKFFEKHSDDLESALNLTLLGKYDHTKTKNTKDVLFLMSINK